MTNGTDIGEARLFAWQVYDRRSGVLPPDWNPWGPPELGIMTMVRPVFLVSPTLDSLRQLARAKAAEAEAELVKLHQEFRQHPLCVRVEELRAKLAEKRGIVEAEDRAARSAQAHARAALAAVRDPSAADLAYGLAANRAAVAEAHATELAERVIPDAEKAARRELEKILYDRAAELRAAAQAEYNRRVAVITAAVGENLAEIMKLDVVSVALDPSDSKLRPPSIVGRLAAQLPV